MGPEQRRSAIAWGRDMYVSVSYLSSAEVHEVIISTCGVGRLRGPLEAVVPLLASSIRHADRMALAMESRAFGAHPTRTERTPSRWRPRDTAFTLTLWLLTAALFLL